MSFPLLFVVCPKVTPQYRKESTTGTGRAANISCQRSVTRDALATNILQRMVGAAELLFYAAMLWGGGTKILRHKQYMMVSYIMVA